MVREIQPIAMRAEQEPDLDARFVAALREANIDLASSGLSLELERSFAGFEDYRVSLRDPADRLGRLASRSGRLRVRDDVVETHLISGELATPVEQAFALSTAEPAHLYDRLLAMAEAIMITKSDAAN